MSRRATAVAACLVLVALPLTGCGGKKKGIPRADVTTIVGLLKDAKKQAAAKPPDCTGLAATIQKLNTEAQGLPGDVDANVKDSLTNGIGNLQNLATQQCTQTQTTPTTTTPTTPTTPTQTTPTQTTPTQTTPTTPTNTGTTPTTTTPPSGGQTAPGPGAVLPPGQQKKSKGPKGTG